MYTMCIIISERKRQANPGKRKHWVNIFSCMIDHTISQLYGMVGWLVTVTADDDYKVWCGLPDTWVTLSVPQPYIYISNFDVELFTPLSSVLECEWHNNKLCHSDFPPIESLTEKLDFMLNPDNAAKREQDMERARQSARDDWDCHCTDKTKWMLNVMFRVFLSPGLGKILTD